MFAALPVPEELARTVIESAAGIHDDGLRWILPEQAHLTLAFLGSLDEDRIADTAAALAGVDAPAFDLELTQAAVFPSRSSPRVVALLPDENEQLHHLFELVRAALLPNFFDLPDKLRAHVTVARSKQGRRRQAHLPADAIQSILPQQFNVTEFKLFSSITAPDRAYYSVIRSYPLDMPIE